MQRKRLKSPIKFLLMTDKLEIPLRIFKSLVSMKDTAYNWLCTIRGYRYYRL